MPKLLTLTTISLLLAAHTLSCRSRDEQQTAKAESITAYTCTKKLLHAPKNETPDIIDPTKPINGLDSGETLSVKFDGASARISSRLIFAESRKPALEDDMSCDRNFNCRGSRVRFQESGSSTASPLAIATVAKSSSVSGSVGTAPVFIYKPNNRNGFEFTAVKESKGGQPTKGLIIACGR